MTTMEMQHSLLRPATRIGIVSFVMTAFRGWRSASEDQRALRRLARMSPRLLRDMGFDPAEIYGAVDGTWDEVTPGTYRRLGE